MNPLPAFATVDDLSEWLGETIEQEADRIRADRCLRAASNRIRGYTKRDWTDGDGHLADPLPEALQDVCLAAAGRFYTNPGGETQWTRQIDDAMDGGSRRVDEAGIYLTASEMRTLDYTVADQSPLVAGLGVVSTTRGEAPSPDMSPCWFDDGTPGFLHARLDG